jgi:hypothetical protein
MGICRASAARARLSALATDCSVVSRRSATSRGGEVEDVVQDQVDALSGWQQLQRRDEDERDGLACLVAGFGTGGAVRQVGEEHVGIGLERDDLAQPGRFGRLDIEYRQAPASRAQHVQAASNGDAVQPTRARPSYSPRPPDSYLTLLRARRCWRTRWTREVSPAAAGGRSLPARRFGRSILFWESCSFIRVYTRLRLPAVLDLGSALARSQAEAGGPNVLAPQFIRPNSSLCPQNRHEMNRDSVITVILTDSKGGSMPCDRAPGTGDTVSGPFINWAENVTTNPQQIFQPTTLDELVAIVKQAEADNLSVHAVGSGWSFTDVMTATGYMVRTDNLNGVPEPKINPPAGFAAPPLGYGSSNVLTPQVLRKPLATLSETMTNTPYPNDPVFGALTPAAHQRNLCHVEAGIKIADLYTFLEGIPSGITTPDGLWHGYAVKTLGGSGGQAITGAITTSTHGGDDHDSNGQPIRPLPEMVQGIRMVGADGVEYFVQRSSTRAIIHPGLLAQLDPCLAGPGQIITSEDFLNAVVVSMGRMGVIYSVVLEVLPQYFLAETVTQGRWNQVIPTITDLREANRFLQVLILPYATYEQSQIGNNTTASTPFVTPDPSGGAWVYFQGTDNTLWKVRDDGSQQSQIGNNTTASTPFVTPDGWVYFQGTDNTLWKVRDDGSQQSQIANNTTASTPFVTPDGWVYFQGTDTSLFRGPGTLWKIRTDDDRTCFTTTRNEVEAANFTPSNPFPSLGSRIFTFACEEPPAALAAQIAAIVGGLEAFVAGGSILLGIPIVGPLLAGLDIAAAITLIALLTPLLDSSATIGDYLATAVNILDQLGQISFTESLVNSILGSLGPQSGTVRQDVSFRIMDGYDYKGSCFKALSLEVGFNADDTAYLDYISAVFNLINNFSAQNILTGAYISLRYCAGSSALLAIEQWPHTVCIEISALAHLNGEQQVLSAFENETANHIGRDGRPPTVHWGQLNARSPGQVDAAFPEINTWRSVLARLTMNGKPSTFDNDFCENHGLETLGVKPAATGSDQSYLAPLLFQRPGTDLSYLLPLLST